jgi:hypothetical protein
MNTVSLQYFNFVLAIALVIGFITLVWKHKKTDRLRREFFTSGLKKDLEQILIDQNRGITKINQQLDQIEMNLSALTEKNQHNLQKIGFVKYNPFDDAGGNISFALALLNAEDEGVVISSLHGREGTRMYAKSVKNGKSETKLTEEEEEAIKKAE